MLPQDIMTIRKYGWIRRISLPAMCSVLLILLLLVYIADFPKFQISLGRPSTVREIVHQEQTPATETPTQQLQDMIKRLSSDRHTSTNQEIDKELVSTTRLTTITTRSPTTILKEAATRKSSKEQADEKTTKRAQATSTKPPKTKLLEEDKMREVERRFQARKERLTESCVKTGPRQMKKCEADDVIKGLKHIQESDLLYCAIEKTGSTFWKRILHVAGGWSNNSNPHSIAAKDADEKHGGFQSLGNVTYDQLMKIFQTSKSIMFVRDPLTRMFSAWLDKFYSTNPYYWELYGRRIIMSERKNATNESLTCGDDVTFPEFVSFVSKVVKRDKCLDRHFNPNFKHCAPCRLSYDYIGKYETLKEDTYFLLEKLNLSNVVRFTNFESDATNDVIHNDADWVFRKRNETEDCVPFRCSLFRVWKRLQSRGIISKTIDLPYKTNAEANETTVEEFTKAITDAHLKSDTKEIARNREEVLTEAYGLLSDKLKKRLLDALAPDFDLFGYDRNHTLLQSNSSWTKRKTQYTVKCPFTFEDP